MNKGTDQPIDGNVTNRIQVSSYFKILLGGPRVPAYREDPGKLKNWLTAIRK